MTVDNRQTYRELCDRESGFSLFQQAWWLDAVSENKWDAFFVEEDGQIVGANAYHRLSKLGYTFSKMPMLTQHIGPWISPKVARDSDRMNILRSLARQIRSVDWWTQNWSTAHTNWLPFYWEGFRQTTRYTYRITDLRNIEYVWSQLSKSKRRDIRRAKSGDFGITFDSEPQPNDFLDLTWGTFARQNMEPPYSRDFLSRLLRASEDRGQSRIIIARDKDGNAHAAALAVWDHETLYYLVGGSDPQFRNSQAGSMCIWEIIRLAASQGLAFDFEGSMIEPIEKYFRGFGAQRVPYYTISRVGPFKLSIFAWMRQRNLEMKR